VLQLAIVESTVVHSSRELLGAKAPLYGRFFKGNVGHFYVLTGTQRLVTVRRATRRSSIAEAESFMARKIFQVRSLLDAEGSQNRARARRSI